MGNVHYRVTCQAPHTEPHPQPWSSMRRGSDEAPSGDCDQVILGYQVSPHLVNLAMPPGKVKHQQSCPLHQTGSSQRLGQGPRDTGGWWRRRARPPKSVNLSSSHSGSCRRGPRQSQNWPGRSISTCKARRPRPPQDRAAGSGRNSPHKCWQMSHLHGGHLSALLFNLGAAVLQRGNRGPGEMVE